MPTEIEPNKYVRRELIDGSRIVGAYFPELDGHENVTIVTYWGRLEDGWGDFERIILSGKKVVDMDFGLYEVGENGFVDFCHARSPNYIPNLDHDRRNQVLEVLAELGVVELEERSDDKTFRRKDPISKLG